MDFTVPLPLSLRDTCVNAIGVSLWTPDYVVAVIKEMDEKKYSIYSEFHELDIWTELFENITRKIEELRLPSQFKDKLYEIVIPIACQIRYWYQKLIKHKLPVVYVAENYASRMVWLPQGGLDFDKMMFMLLNDEGIAADVRLRLACYYGDSKILRELWAKIEPADFHGKDLNVIKERESIIVAYRIHVVNHRLPDLVEFYHLINPETSFPLSLMSEKYFYETGTRVVRRVWSMLDYDEKLKALALINTRRVNVEILNLWKNISFNDLGKIFENSHGLFCPEDIPTFLLKWPQRVNFKRIVPLLLKHLTNSEEYKNLLRSVFFRLDYEKLDKFYEDLPKFVWNEIPLRERKNLLSDQSYMTEIINCLSGSFMSQDILRGMLENASIRQKRNLLFGRCFDWLLEQRRLDACEVLLKEIIKSKEDLEEFKSLRLDNISIKISTMLKLGAIITSIQQGLNSSTSE